jgi:parvulin-like peptidyl-prolyl isomerase
MTFRARPVVKRTDRVARGPRRTLLLNLAFGLVILIALLILGAAAAANYYGDHFASVADVNGHGISKDQLRERIKVEQFRLDITLSRISDAVQSGRLDQASADQQTNYINQQLGSSQAITQGALNHLIDGELQSELAGSYAISVTDGQIDKRLTDEATTKEERHAWVIAVKPETTGSATKPTDAQKKAAEGKANKALADLKAGKKWEDVAKTSSTDYTAPQGGDMGWIQSDDASLDKAFLDALFKLQPNAMTDVLVGEDGIYRIGRVTDVSPEKVDSNYQQSIVDRGVPLPVYRAAVKLDLIRDALKDKVVADLTTKPSVQRHVAEIYIQPPLDDQGNPITEDQVEVRHILYAPNHDASKASDVPASDPAWKAAEDLARATYEKLKKDPDPKKFAEIAKKESDDKGTAPSGGELPWAYQKTYDPAFGAAIFAPNLTKDQILEPVKSAFGWHVIQFIGRREPAEEKAAGLELQAAGGDFAALAKANSDAPQEEKDKGGDIGWVAPFQMDPVLEKAIFATKAPGVSSRIDSNGTFYIFKVFEEQSRMPDQSQIDTLKADGFDNWYAAQRDKAKINTSSGTATDSQG